MKKAVLAGLFVIGATMSAGAQDTVPSFLGTWWGDFEVALLQRSDGAAPQGQKEKLTYEITKQEGRLLWGTVTSDQGGGTRPMVLAFSFNNGTLIGSDTHGLHRLTVISPTRMESCFTDNGSGPLIATCGVLNRAPPGQ